MSSPNSTGATTTPGIVTRIEALGYRSLRYVSQALGPFHVLVGPNASGKSSFLDVVAFLGDLVREGAEAAVQGDPRFGIPLRAPDGKQLSWMRQRDRFELAIELSIPPEQRADQERGRRHLPLRGGDRCPGPAADRPERRCGSSLSRWSARFLSEDSFLDPLAAPGSIVHVPRKHTPAGWKKVVSRGEEPERVMFQSETSGWNNPFRLESDKTALASLPEDEERFPVATWFRKVLAEGVQRLVLSSEDMRRPSPPGRSRGYLPDGSNLPHVVHALQEGNPDRFAQWIQHVREALPDLKDITTHERDEDRHRYLVLRHASGLQAPSWLVSDGSLRLLALTLLAYLPDLSGIYLIEEPENGIHPRAVETVFQSLSSVYGAQVLLATHSPVVASMAEIAAILCFARTARGRRTSCRQPASAFARLEGQR